MHSAENNLCDELLLERVGLYGFYDLEDIQLYSVIIQFGPIVKTVNKQKASYIIHPSFTVQ